MPRKPREFEIGNVYHIVNRGVEKRKIFLKNQDYGRFTFALEFFNDETLLDLWDLIVGFNPARIEKRLQKRRHKSKKQITDVLTFTLMPNHYHLVLKEIIPNGISLFMQKLGGYATYFNKQHDRVGSLFQSRYTSVHIKDDVQLSTVFTYVHTNPVELIEPGWKKSRVKSVGGSVAFLKNYKWSSYRDYIGIPTFPTVTQRGFFLDFFGGEQKCKEVVEDWIRYKAKTLSSVQRLLVIE